MLLAAAFCIAAVPWGWCDFSRLMWLKHGACILNLSEARGEWGVECPAGGSSDTIWPVASGWSRSQRRANEKMVSWHISYQVTLKSPPMGMPYRCLIVWKWMALVCITAIFLSELPSWKRQCLCHCLYMQWYVSFFPRLEMRWTHIKSLSHMALFHSVCLLKCAAPAQKALWNMFAQPVSHVGLQG